MIAFFLPMITDPRLGDDTTASYHSDCKYYYLPMPVGRFLAATAG